MFKAAAKVLAARDDEARPQARKRKSGEKESGAPIRRRAAIVFPQRLQRAAAMPDCDPSGKNAARLLRKFTAAADDAGLPELSETHEIARGQYARMAQPMAVPGQRSQRARP